MSGKWYPSLYHQYGLFRDFPLEDLEPLQLLISMTLPGESKRHFRLFSSPDDFQEFLINIPMKKRHFFEVIIGNWKQKPHFDIDKIENKDKTSEQLENIAQQVREEIAQQLSLLGIHPSSLRWYTSNSAVKKSMHLIIPGYYFENNLEAGRLWQYLDENLPEEYRQYLDGSVYSSLQNFRLMGSHKPPKKKGDPRRIKTLLTQWYCSGEEIEVEIHNGMFNESLVSFIPADAKPFPKFEIKNKIIPKIFNDQTDLPDGLIEMVNEVVLESLENTVEFYRCSGSLISYQRIAPGACKICSPFKPDHDKEHEADNPFVSVVKSGVSDGNWNVFLHCHRARVHVQDPKKRSILLAKFKNTETDPDDVPNCFTDLL